MIVQDLQLELMRHSSFNNFDGERVANDLAANKHLWVGALMRMECGDDITLRDLPDDNNVDTLYITCRNATSASVLIALAEQSWDADEAGHWDRVHVGKHTIRIWWD